MKFTPGLSVMLGFGVVLTLFNGEAGPFLGLILIGYSIYAAKKEGEAQHEAPPTGQQSFGASGGGNWTPQPSQRFRSGQPQQTAGLQPSSIHLQCPSSGRAANGSSREETCAVLWRCRFHAPSPEPSQRGSFASVERSRCRRRGGDGHGCSSTSTRRFVVARRPSTPCSETRGTRAGQRGSVLWGLLVL